MQRGIKLGGPTPNNSPTRSDKCITQHISSPYNMARRKILPRNLIATNKDEKTVQRAGRM